MDIIKCSDVCLAYENKLVVKNLTFELKKGSFLCIIGENGSGKSTLVKAFLGLIPLNNGKIIYGNDLKKNEIGYLPQQTELQKDFPASVYEIILSGCGASSKIFLGKNEKKLAEKNIELLGLSKLKKRSYRELSGGQQQKVLLARALCATKKLLILDEPVSGLDPVSSAELYEYIAMINKNHGITIIMVSHDVVKSLEHADFVLHMHNEKPFFASKNDYLHCNDCKRFLGEVHTCD